LHTYLLTYLDATVTRPVSYIYVSASLPRFVRQHVSPCLW